MRRMCAFLVVFAVAAFSLRAVADVTPASLFQDNMVLQQGIKVPVWGTAAPDEKVTVTFGKQTKQAVAGKDGKWRLSLDALKAEPNQAPQEMTIAGKNTITITNVLVGEVWICSGQSNMELPLAAANNGKTEVDQANFPAIRMFAVGKAPSAVPQEKCAGSWAVCEPGKCGGFSAVGYFFARNLHQQLNVPVGMINASWGGTPAEPWTEIGFLKKMPIFQERIAKYEAAVAEYNANKDAYEAKRKDAAKKAEEAKAQWSQQQIDTDPGMQGK